MFRGKHGPDDFGFPACAEFNRAMALSEQAIASSVLHNRGTFLQKTAEQIVSLDEGHDKPFDVDRAMLVTAIAASRGISCRGARLTDRYRS